MGAFPCSILLIIIETTFLNGSSYFCLGPIILCGTAITHSILFKSQRFIKTSSAATFEIA